jgi:hypothetical protein
VHNSINLRLVKNIVLFYVLWIPLEWPVIKLLSIIASGTIPVIRLFFDLVPIVIMGALLLLQKSINKYILFILLSYGLIFSLCLFNLFSEGRDLAQVIPFLGVTIRFMPFLYFGSILDTEEINYLKGIVRITLYVLIGVGIFSVLYPDLSIEIFLPNKMYFNESVPTAYNQFGEIAGTFVTTIDFGFWMLLSFFFVFDSFSNSILKWGLFLIVLILLYNTGSLSTILCFFLLMLFIVPKKFALPFTLVGSILVILLGPFLLEKTVGQSSLEEYIYLSGENNRLGFIIYLIPEFLSSVTLKDLLLGYTIDEQLLTQKLFNFANAPEVILYDSNKIVTLLKDVYWVSIFLTQGLMGLALYVLIITVTILYFRLYLTKNELVKIVLLVSVFAFGAFFNQVLDLKSFAFFFWLFLGIQLAKTYNNKIA